MGELISCGMTREQIEAEAAEAERETAEYEAKRKADWEAYLASLSKDARYYQTHKARRMYDTAMERARKKGAVPKWLTEEDKAAILLKYQLAVEREIVTGVPHSVDHIMPLLGVCRKTWLASGRQERMITVCGFHVPENLRVIPLGINRDIKKDWFDSNWPAFPVESRKLYGFELTNDGDEGVPF